MCRPRLRLIAVAGACVVLAVLATAPAASAVGALTLSGTGLSVSLNDPPGVWSGSIGATTLTMSDTTLTTNGWAVTATYGAPALPTKPLGGANVAVTTGTVSGAVPAASVSTVTDAPLTSPVTVLSTGANSGAGVTTAVASLKVRIPQTAQNGEIYGCSVTYTIASVR
jgi:hypothetical protein